MFEAQAETLDGQINLRAGRAGGEERRALPRFLPLSDQLAQQKLAEMPSTETRIRIDMARRARVREAAAPELRETARPVELDIAVVPAADKDRRD